MRPEQLAINSVTTSRSDLATCIGAYSDAGFRNVEFAFGHVRSFVAEGKSVDEARRLIEGHGMRCIGGFEAALTCFGDAESKRKNWSLLADTASVVRDLGGATMVVGTDGPSAQDGSGDPIGQLAQAFADFAGKIEATGVEVCLEFNWSPVVKSFRTAAEVARRSRAANVGVLFDPAHYHCSPSKFSELTPQNVRTIKHVHVNDMRDKPGELSHCNADRVLPGEGILDLAAIFGEIEAHGYQGYFSLELFDEEIASAPPSETAGRLYASMLGLCG